MLLFCGEEVERFKKQKPIVEENLEEKKRKEKIDNDIEGLRDAVNEFGENQKENLNEIKEGLNDIKNIVINIVITEINVLTI